MRYKYIANPGSGKPVHAKPIITLKGNMAIVNNNNTDYSNNYREKIDILYRDSESGICITKQRVLSPVTSKETTVHNMLIPETHPLFNYGILLEEMKFDIKLGMEDIILSSVTALYKELEHHINN